MTPSRFASWFRNRSLLKHLEKKRLEAKSVYDQKETELIQEFEVKLDALRRLLSDKNEVVERKIRDVEDLEERATDRKKELERTYIELKTQLRLVEAKASPDNIWATAFSQGFSKAWDMMLPIMTDGMSKLKDQIRNREIEDSFPRIDMVVQQRILDMGNPTLLEASQIDAKRREFELRISKTSDTNEKQKLSNYIYALDWVMANRNGN